MVVTPIGRHPVRLDSSSNPQYDTRHLADMLARTQPRRIGGLDRGIGAMNGKEKMLAALSPEGTAEVPAVICYESIYVRDHWDQLTSCPWWYRFSPELAHQLAWRREAFGRTRQDWFHVPPCPARARREAMTIEQRQAACSRSIGAAAGKKNLSDRP